MSLDVPTALDPAPAPEPAPVTYGNPATDPILTVRVHPDDDPRSLLAMRVWKVAVASADEWPWRRATGLATRTPAQGTDLSTWPIQPLGDAALAMGHTTILTGRVVG